jgi:hypothetical protein
MMDHKGVRIALFALNVFVGLTAVAGGIGFLTGGFQICTRPTAIRPGGVPANDYDAAPSLPIWECVTL